MNEKNNEVINLGDPHVKQLFRRFIKETMQRKGITTKKLEDRLDEKLSQKTLGRYLNLRIDPPKTKIRDSTYFSFLKALETTHEEFKRFVSVNAQNKDETQLCNDVEVSKPSQPNLSNDQASEAPPYLPLVSENLQNKGKAQFNSDFEVSKLSKSSLSNSQPSKTPHRLPRLFVYLSLWLIPLILLITFLLWPNQATYYERGVIAKEQKQHAKAIDFFTMAIEKDNKNADAYYELADIYAELTDNSSAIEHYRKGIAEDTKFSTRAYNNLALLLLAQNDINNTLVLLDRAQQNIITPIEKERWTQSGIILKNQAWAYWKSGLYTEAMKLIIQAQKQLGPAQMLDHFPEVFCLHALIAKHTGDPDPAEQLCINRFEAYQEKQQSGAFGNTIKPIHGMSYELYLRVLKQRDDK